MKKAHKMKVAVSSNGNNLDARLDQRFGRCAFFLVVNSDDMSFEAFNNESAAQKGGAGTQAAQFLASQGGVFEGRSQVLKFNCVKEPGSWTIIIVKNSILSLFFPPAALHS